MASSASSSGLSSSSSGSSSSSISKGRDGGGGGALWSLGHIFPPSRPILLLLPDLTAKLYTQHLTVADLQREFPDCHVGSATSMRCQLAPEKVLHPGSTYYLTRKSDLEAHQDKIADVRPRPYVQHRTASASRGRSRPRSISCCRTQQASTAAPGSSDAVMTSSSRHWALHQQCSDAPSPSQSPALQAAAKFPDFSPHALGSSSPNCSRVFCNNADVSVHRAPRTSTVSVPQQKHCRSSSMPRTLLHFQLDRGEESPQDADEADVAPITRLLRMSQEWRLEDGVTHRPSLDWGRDRSLDARSCLPSTPASLAGSWGHPSPHCAFNAQCSQCTALATAPAWQPASATTAAPAGQAAAAAAAASAAAPGRNQGRRSSGGMVPGLLPLQMSCDIIPQPELLSTANSPFRQRARLHGSPAGRNVSISVVRAHSNKDIDHMRRPVRTISCSSERESSGLSPSWHQEGISDLPRLGGRKVRVPVSISVEDYPVSSPGSSSSFSPQTLSSLECFTPSSFAGESPSAQLSPQTLGFSPRFGAPGLKEVKSSRFKEHAGATQLMQ